MIRQAADDEIVVVGRDLRPNIADHLARQHGAVRLDHRQPPPGEASATGPGPLRRTHDRKHRAIEQNEQPGQSRRRAVRRCDTGAQARVRRFVYAAEQTVCGLATQAREFQLIEPEALEMRDDRWNRARILRGCRDAGMYAQLRQPLARLAQKPQGALDFRKQPGDATQPIVFAPHAVHGQCHHDPPEWRDIGQAFEQPGELFRIGAVGRHAERTHPGAIVGSDDLREIVAQQRLASSQRKMAQRPDARGQPPDARQVHFGRATDSLPLRHVEAVAAVGVAAMRQELDQITGRAG